MKPVRVLTVDDKPAFLDVVRAVIASTPGFLLAGEARSGVDAVVAARELHPDLVLMDVRMPGSDGIETARRLTAARSAEVIVLVTSDDTTGVRELAARSGAAELVAKERLRPRVLRQIWDRHGEPRRAIDRWP